ncbi:MAG: hypothetical protein AAGG02_20410 [Cyanobacteria bacterium P01_H01_bin.15]
MPKEVLDLLKTDDSGATAKRSAVPSDVPPLDQMEIEAHIYRDAGKSSFGVLKSLFVGDLDIVRSGVIQEAKRFTIVDAAGTLTQIGVAVRLAVATNTTDLNAKLSVENLAAAAQLGMAETRVKISVTGFIGDIVDLPGVSTLDVKNYQVYLDSFTAIQSQVFSVAGRSDWSPTILGWDESG